MLTTWAPGGGAVVTVGACTSGPSPVIGWLLLAVLVIVPIGTAIYLTRKLNAVAIKLMGHADTAILRRYQEVVDDLQTDAAARMDHLLGRAQG